MAAVASSDLGSAIAYVRAHATGLGIDAGRLCTLVFASATPLEAQPWLRCGVVYYGAPEGDPARMPPLLVVKAGRDEPGTNGAIDRFEDAARASHADVRVITNAAARKGFDVGPRTARSRAVVRETLRYLTARLAKPLRILEPCVSKAEKASALRFFTSEDVQLAGVVRRQRLQGARAFTRKRRRSLRMASLCPRARIRRLSRAQLRRAFAAARRPGDGGRGRGPEAHRGRACGRRRVVTWRARRAHWRSFASRPARCCHQPLQPESLRSVSTESPRRGSSMSRCCSWRRKRTTPSPTMPASSMPPRRSPARRLEIFPGGDHGVGMLREPAVRALFDSFLAAHL